MHTALTILGVLASIVFCVFIFISVYTRGEKVLSNRYILFSLTILPIMHLLITNDIWRDQEKLKLGSVTESGSIAQDLVIWVGILLLVLVLLCLRKKRAPFRTTLAMLGMSLVLSLSPSALHHVFTEFLPPFLLGKWSWLIWWGYTVAIILLFKLNEVVYTRNTICEADDDTLFVYVRSCTGGSYLWETAAAIFLLVAVCNHTSTFKLLLIGTLFCEYKAYRGHWREQGKSYGRAFLALLIQQTLAILMLPQTIVLGVIIAGTVFCIIAGETSASSSSSGYAGFSGNTDSTFSFDDDPAAEQKRDWEQQQAAQAEKERRQRESYVQNELTGEKYRMNSDCTRYYDNGEWKKVSDIK